MTSAFFIYIYFNDVSQLHIMTYVTRTKGQGEGVKMKNETGPLTFQEDVTQNYSHLTFLFFFIFLCLHFIKLY